MGYFLDFMFFQEFSIKNDRGFEKFQKILQKLIIIFSGFDWVFHFLPAITKYHLLLVTLVGYVATIGGYTAVFPVFAQYKPPARYFAIFI